MIIAAGYRVTQTSELSEEADHHRALVPIGELPVPSDDVAFTVYADRSPGATAAGAESPFPRN